MCVIVSTSLYEDIGEMQLAQIEANLKVDQGCKGRQLVAKLGLANTFHNRDEASRRTAGESHCSVNKWRILPKVFLLDFTCSQSAL